MFLIFPEKGLSKTTDQNVLLDTIKVKGDYYYPPFEFINKNGEPDGFNIDLFRELAKELNINYTLELDQWSKVRKELENGQIDVITGMMISSSRADKIKFSTPHSVMTHSVFSRKTDSFEKLSDLRNKEIVVQKGDMMHDFLLDTRLTNKIIAVSSQHEALDLINNGKHDAALIGSFQGFFLIKQYRFKNIRAFDINLAPQKYAIAVNSQNDELLWLLNMGLYQLKAKGIYDKLYYKWFGIYEDYSLFKKHKSAIIAFVIALLLMVFFIVTLRIEIKRAKSKIIVSESRYRDIFEKNHAVMFILDPDSGAIIDANPAAVSFYGYSKDSLIKMKLSDINTLAHEELRDKLQKAKEGNVHYYDFKHRMASGEIRDVEIYTGPVQFGSNRYLFSILHDVTDKKIVENALKDNEAKLNLIFNMAPSGMGITINRIFTDVNPTFCKMTGYSQAELTGKNARLVYCSDEDYDLVGSEKQRQIMDHGVGVIETRLKHRYGKIIDVIISSAAIDPNDLSKGVIFTVTDVTLQKEASRQIHLANERIRMHIENSPLAVIEWDNQHRVKMWSRQAEDLFGWTSDEVMNRSHLEWDIIYKDDIYAVNQDVNKLITGVETRAISYNRNITKDGRILHCQWYNSAVFDENGLLISILSLVNDVTNLKIIEKELIEERQRLAWIIDATRAGTWEWDIKKNEIFINEHFAAILGFNIEELQPLSFKRWREMIHPEDVEHSDVKLSEHFKNPLKEYELEARIRHKDGHWVWEHIKGRIMSYSPQGDPLFMAGMNTDINKRKTAEEQIKKSEMLLSIAGKLANLGGWSIDVLHNTVFWSEEVAAIHERPFGYSPTVEECIRFYSPEHQQRITDVVSRCINEGIPFDEEMQIITSTGRLVWVRNIGFPKRNENGDICIIYGGFQDITQQKKAEEEIKSLNTQLEQKVEDRTAKLLEANKELEAFSYSVSHDLKAPLRAIDGFTSILVEDHTKSLNQEGLRICNVILENTKKMNQLINDLLTFSKVGRTEIFVSNVDMKALVLAVIEDMTNTNIQFNVDDLEWCLGDVKMLKQVWVNLISNAVKFSSKNSYPQVWISCYKEKDSCIYSVQDNGVGFDMKYVGKIFEVFQRLHSNREFEGTGVGLAIVQRIIQRQGGKIWAEGAVNQGATFFFSLPAST